MPERDTEIKNRLMVTRGVEGKWEKQAKGHQETCIKDTRTKPKGIGSRVGGRDGGGGGHGGVKLETTVLEQS